mgnify:FL=1
MLRSWNKLKTIKNSIKQLKGMQEQNIGDDYSCGIYNGIELCMAIIEEREPVFATYDSEPVNIEQSEKLERTVASGIIRRGEKQ